MSARPNPSAPPQAPQAPGAGAVGLGGTTNADQIRAMIEQAKLANESFLLSNPQLSTGSSYAETPDIELNFDYDLDYDLEGIGAPPTRVQRLAELNRPFKLEFNQVLQKSTVEKDKWVAKISVILSGGVFQRLAPMMKAFSNIFEPYFKSKGFNVRMSGILYKVCAKPSKSTVEWAFEKTLEGKQLEKAMKGDVQFWVLPDNKPSPFSLLKSVFNDDKSKLDPNGVVDGTKYVFQRASKSTIGKVAVFELKLQ